MTHGDRWVLVPPRSTLVALGLAVLLYAGLFGALLSQVSAQTKPAAAVPDGDAARGQRLYEARCGACHSVDQDRIGPRHRGVVGRAAGSVAGFRYTEALASAGLVWDAPTLDRWLQGPTILVPGTSMGLSLKDPADRRDVIAYLGSVS